MLLLNVEAPITGVPLWDFIIKALGFVAIVLFVQWTLFNEYKKRIDQQTAAIVEKDAQIIKAKTGELERAYKQIEKVSSEKAQAEQYIRDITKQGTELNTKLLTLLELMNRDQAQGRQFLAKEIERVPEQIKGYIDSFLSRMQAQ